MHPTEEMADASLLTPTVAEIKLDQLRHNIRVLKKQAGAATMMGVIKANAYGHGAVRFAQVLQEEGVHYFATATIPEAVRLREAGIEHPILVLAAPLPEFLPAYARHRLDVTVSSYSVAEAIASLPPTTGPFRVHVKADTGMGRIGMSREDVLKSVNVLEIVPEITLAGLWTHFATATTPHDAFAEEQLARFTPIYEQVGHAFEHIHLAQSGALLTFPASFEPFPNALVRVGIALYGIGEPRHPDLYPLMRLTSRITHIKTVDPGTPISYNCTWRAPKRTRIATIGAGYADGYPRLLSNRGEVGIGGHLYPIVGTICMDMFMVDLGAPDGSGSTISVGDEAVLFGQGGPPTYDVAQAAQTIPYEICCGIAARVPRRYQ